MWISKVNGMASWFYSLWDFNSRSEEPSDSTIVFAERPMILRIPKGSYG